MSAHLGDDAALYALGALEDDERRSADEHLATCDACRRLVAGAEADVTAMIELQPQYEPPAQRISAAPEPVTPASGWSFRRVLPAAAAVIALLLPSAYFYRAERTMQDAMLAQSAAIDRVMSTPHRTVAFTGVPGAQVMYGYDGSWYCVVIPRAKQPMGVVWMHGGKRIDLGTAMPHGEVAMLYLPESHRMDTLALVASQGVVGRADLIF